MKKTLLALTLLFLSSTYSVHAAGFCSSHGGVSCKSGAQVNGHVICNDGFKGSSGIYANMKECNTNKSTTTAPSAVKKSTSMHKKVGTIMPTKVNAKKVIPSKVKKTTKNTVKPSKKLSKKHS